jgi:hypothetical protein
MKISDILIEATPQGTVSHNRPKVVSPLNKQVRDAGQQMLNKADDAAQDRIGPGDQDMPVSAEERFNRGMGGMMKKIGSGNMNKITDKQLQSATVAGKDYAKELQGQLDKTVANVGKPKAKPTTQDLQSK